MRKETKVKKVALITDGWKRLITYDWVRGITRRIKEQDERIVLFHYNCHGSWSTDTDHNHGEFNIYRLPDLNTFDGVILDITNIRNEADSLFVENILKDVRVPVISIAKKLQGFHCIFNDNAGAIRSLMDHLYHEHGCRSFYYAGGPDNAYENLVRSDSYKERLRAFGLSLEENPIFFDDYELTSGTRIFEKLLDEQLPMPDAFVCCNDNVAAGLIDCAVQNGFRVPNDFLVTGFDYLDKAQYFNPQITSVEHQRVAIGYECMSLLINHWNGSPIPEDNFIPCILHYAESCSCVSHEKPDYRKIVKDNIINKDHSRVFDELLLSFETRITHQKNFQDIFEETARYMTSLECDGFAIAIDKRLLELADINTFPEDGYELSQLDTMYTSQKDAPLIHTSYQDLMQLMEEAPSGTAYLFTPIHFGRKNIGFTVLKNGRFLFDNPYYYNIHVTFTNTIQSLYRMLLIEKMNEQLKRIYNRDPLTGLYNRMAFSELVSSHFEEYSQDESHYALLFSDVDHFKVINDTKGHEEGDRVLKKVAGTLKTNCPENGFVFRFGGDEFVMFFPCNSEDDILSFRKKLELALEEHDIQMSIGYIMIHPYDERSFEDCLHEADHEMYRVKNARKTCR